MLTLLVDGNNLAYRARYAYSLSHQGLDTSVTFGMMKMVQALLKQYKPHSAIMCWDGGVPDYRRLLVPSYKANRKSKDDPSRPIFLAQMDELQVTFPFFGVLSVHRRGLEADDLMYQATILLDNETLIVSSDDDMLQAVSKTCRVLKPGKPDRMVALNNMEIDPAEYAEWKTWQGDSSDNIPGVRGIGPKTATQLFKGDRANVSHRIRDKMDEFCESGAFDDAYNCIDLSVDRSGARSSLLDAMYQPFSRVKATRWLMKWGFASLIDQRTLGQTFGRLDEPEFNSAGMAIPRVWDYRREPVDDR